MNVLVRKGLIVAALHVALVSSLGAKLLLDRATQPRVWVRTAPYDPNLPIRGRYVRLRIEVGTDGQKPAGPVELTVRNGQLVAMPASDSTGLNVQDVQRGGRGVTILVQPLAYFIPEHLPIRRSVVRTRSSGSKSRSRSAVHHARSNSGSRRTTC